MERVVEGLREITEANRQATAAKNKADPRVQRDRLMQCLRRVLANEPGAEIRARAALTEIYGR